MNFDLLPVYHTSALSLDVGVGNVNITHDKKIEGGKIANSV